MQTCNRKLSQHKLEKATHINCKENPTIVHWVLREREALPACFSSQSFAGGSEGTWWSRLNLDQGSLWVHNPMETNERKKEKQNIIISPLQNQAQIFLLLSSAKILLTVTLQHKQKRFDSTGLVQLHRRQIFKIMFIEYVLCAITYNPVTAGHHKVGLILQPFTPYVTH